MGKSFIDDCDRRTELQKKRLAETQEELSAEVTSKMEKVHNLQETIAVKLAAAEEAGAAGKVEESLKLMEEVEELGKKKLGADQEYRNSMPASSYQQQKLRVCEICSAYLGIHDNDRRLADHFGGKLHLGFIKIREKLAELVNTFEERKDKRREARIADLQEEREERGGLRDYGGREGEERVAMGMWRMQNGGRGRAVETGDEVKPRGEDGVREATETENAHAQEAGTGGETGIVDDREAATKTGGAIGTEAAQRRDAAVQGVEI